MKPILFLLIISFIFATPSISQNIQGVVTYKTDRKMDFKMDSTKVKDAMRERLMAQIKSQSQKEFTLSFDGHRSLYSEVEKLPHRTLKYGNFRYNEWRRRETVL